MQDAEVIVGKRGRYELSSSEPFAVGYVGTLLKAKDQDGKEVCVKVFREQSGREINELNRRAFQNELKIHGSLAHPNILPLLDSGKRANEQLFAVYPYCRGGNLRNIMQGRQFIPTAEAFPILRQIAAAIDFAHQAGYIHGDIKPENILLKESGAEVFLGDFGMASRFKTDINKDSGVGIDFVGGTFAYLSPEQLAEEKQSPRSDIFSLGVVAYEMLLGEFPFAAYQSIWRQMGAKLEGKVMDPAKMIDGFPEDRRAALLLALQPEPEFRPDTAFEFYNMLEGQGEPAGKLRQVEASIEKKKEEARASHEEDAADLTDSARNADAKTEQASDRKASKTGLWASLGPKEKVVVLSAAIAALAGVVTALINKLIG